jgi:anthranilate synthase/phosphoribosyltransferase
MILMIDNYDSFTYNLVQYLGELGYDIVVHRNDQITLEEIERLNPSHIVISPGPGDPDDAGISLVVIERFHQTIPILGVCLGHQAIGQAFGGKIIRAENLMHGKTSLIEHDGQGVFANIPSLFTATRYHSLIVDEELPDCLVVTARTPEGEMMGLRHKVYPTIGVQFHPESILTEHGHQLLQNFLELEVKNVSINDSNPSQPETQNPQLAPARPGETHNPIKSAIAKMMERKHLTEAEAEGVMTQIMAGEATPAQIGAYLTALRMKGETVSEIVGSARAMRNASIKVLPTQTDLVDTCGTGGDGTGTFNISTTAAFVVAGAGQPVAKHGNRSISSKSGSADVLEALGVNLELTPQQVAEAIDTVNLGFMFAPKLHPAMKHAIGPRRELGARTIFNLLGPLTNPANAPAQIMGVYDKDLTAVIAEVLAGLGNKAAFVVHGHGGLDELTTTGPNIVSVLQNGRVTTTVIEPEQLGFRKARPEDLLGGDAQQNADITRNILSGQDTSSRRDVVLLNAAAALVAGGKTQTMREGIDLAAESIDSGAAMNVLENLVAFTQNVAPV